VTFSVFITRHFEKLFSTGIQFTPHAVLFSSSVDSHFHPAFGFFLKHTHTQKETWKPQAARASATLLRRKRLP